MDEFRKKFPNLLKEIDGDSISIKGVRTDAMDSVQDSNSKDSSPSIIDFLRRCNNVDEATEIIAFMESKEEVDEEYARKLRSQLLMRGIGSFGSKKEPGYYEKVKT